jgi:hypothetical protein
LYHSTLGSRIIEKKRELELSLLDLRRLLEGLGA